MASLDPTLQSYEFGLYPSWELDIWGRLRKLVKAQFQAGRVRSLGPMRFEAELRSMQSSRYEIQQRIVEVSNRVSLIRNLSDSYELKRQQVNQLVQSIGISTQLFNRGRANYLEVLTTRRESLEAQRELTEIRQRQMQGMVTLYQALGGGWRGTGLEPPDGSGHEERTKEATQ